MRVVSLMSRRLNVGPKMALGMWVYWHRPRDVVYTYVRGDGLAFVVAVTVVRATKSMLCAREDRDTRSEDPRS